MADPKGTYNSPGAQGWATVLPSGPNFMGMATAIQNQELRKQLAEQAAAEKRRADRDKGIADLMRDFSKPATTHQKYQSMVSADFRALQEEIAKGIAEGRDLSEIRTSAATKYQELKGEAEAGKGVMSLVNAVDAMNKGKDYQRYNVGKIKEYYAGRLVGEDGKLLPPSQVRIEDLSPDKVLYGQGSAGAQFLNKQDVVNSFANSDAMKEISVKWRNNPSQSRSGGMLTTTATGFTQTAKPFQVLDIDKQGKVRVGIMSPEQLLESGVYLAAANDKDMGLLIDAAADEFFSKRLVPPTEQEREYEEARILGEMLTGQVGGASYDRFMSSKVQNLPGSGGGKMTQTERDSQRIWASSEDWWNSLFSSDVSVRAGAARFLDEDKLKPIIPGLGKDETIMDIGMRPDGVMTVRTESKAWDAEAGEHKVTGHTYEVDVNARKEALLNAYSKTSKLSKRYYGTDEAGNKQQQNAPQQPSFQPGFLNK